MNKTQPGWQWNNYWESGAVTTFSEGRFETGYIGPVKNFWRDQIKSLDDSAVIVDLATGNGAIPLIAAEYMIENEKNWNIIGIDYAHIKPPVDKNKELSVVTFHSSTPIENTNIETASVDLVTSQYGIEYADLDKAVMELQRIMKQGAYFTTIMHHPDSLVVKQSKRDIFQTKLCLEIEEFDQKVEKLVSIVGDARTKEQKKMLKHNREAEKTRDIINASLERMYKRLANKEADQMLKITQTFMRVFGDLSSLEKNEKIKFIRDVSASMSAYKARMQSMQKASLSDLDFNQFLKKLEQNQFEIVHSGELRDDNKDILGRVLRTKLSKKA
mgnify:CR=1 FL=1